MLVLIEALSMLNNDSGRKDTFTQIRKIRGQLIRRPRDKIKPREIVADGREEWIGWCDLKTEAVDEVAVMLTANVRFFGCCGGRESSCAADVPRQVC